MSNRTLSKDQEKLLVHLRREQAVKGNAQRVWTKNDPDWSRKRTAAEALVGLGLARRIVIPPEGVMHLELTALGAGEADIRIAEARLMSRILRVNWLGWATLVAATISAVAAAASAYLLYAKLSD